MNENRFREYLAFLRELGQTLDQITKVEQEKTQFVRSDDLEGLNACMKQEQALSMALRSYDQKRDTMLKEMNLEAVSLRGLVDHSPADCKEETKKTVEQLCRQYTLFQSAYEVAQDTLECNLHQINKILQTANPEGESGNYEQPFPQMPAHLRTDFRA